MSSPLSQDTICKMIEMDLPMWNRQAEGLTTELQMWHVDRSEFRFCRPVKVVQTYCQDFWAPLYLCETETGERISSSDLFDHEPTLTADDAGFRYWQ